MATIAKLNVDLAINAAQFTTQLANAEKSAQNFTKRMEQQAATFGMTNREAQIYRLTQRGASEETLQAARNEDSSRASARSKSAKS